MSLLGLANGAEVLPDRERLIFNSIISRVTGSVPSNIFGTLGVLGEATLYFLNPNGIIFDTGAALDLNGSFFGTTASSISFPGGATYSAYDPQPVPLLTIKTPTGLILTWVEVRSKFKEGAELLQPTTTIAPPVSIGPLPQGLAVKPGKTLALVGGNVLLRGGVSYSIFATESINLN